MGTTKSCIIYLAKSPSGKVYVGMTSTTLSKRVCSHKSFAKRGSKLAFHKAIRKYGDRIQFSILKKCASVEIAKKEEIRMIAKFDSMKNGYNSSLGGESAYGKVLSQETKDLISNNSTLKKKVVCDQTGEVYNSVAEATVYLGVTKQHLIKHLKKKQYKRKYRLKDGTVKSCLKTWPTVKGYTFSYVEVK